MSAAELVLTESDLDTITEALECSIEAWREWGGEFRRAPLQYGFWDYQPEYRTARCHAAQRIRSIRGLLRQLRAAPPSPVNREPGPAATDRAGPREGW